MALMDRLFAAKSYVESLGYTPAYLAIYGSQNYGLSLDEPDYRSDVDIKCAALPSLSQLAAEESVAPAVLEWEGGQIEIKDVRRFAEVAARLNPSYLETLMTPHYLAPSRQFDKIRALAALLPGQDAQGFLLACKGTALQKKKNLCHPVPAAMEKIRRFGYDGKQAHHMYRLLLIMRAFEKTGRYELIAPGAEYEWLIALKKNEIPLEDALSLTEDWAQEMEAICARCTQKAQGAKASAREMKQLACLAIEEQIRMEFE